MDRTNINKIIWYYFCAVELHNDRVEAGYTNEQGTQWCDYSDVKFCNHTNGTICVTDSKRQTIWIQSCMSSGGIGMSYNSLVFFEHETNK